MKGVERILRAYFRDTGLLRDVKSVGPNDYRYPKGNLYVSIGRELIIDCRERFSLGIEAMLLYCRGCNYNFDGFGRLPDLIERIDDPDKVNQVLNGKWMLRIESYAIDNDSDKIIRPKEDELLMSVGDIFSDAHLRNAEIRQQLGFQPIPPPYVVRKMYEDQRKLNEWLD